MYDDDFGGGFELESDRDAWEDEQVFRDSRAEFDGDEMDEEMDEELDDEMEEDEDALAEEDAPVRGEDDYLDTFMEDRLSGVSGYELDYGD